jgi:hypothetical protein
MNRHITNKGYAKINMPSHPRADAKGRVLEHIVIIEQTIGKYLPPQAVSHHVNEIRSDNRKSNLVLCNDVAYHQLLHVRLRSYKAVGKVGNHFCLTCKTWQSDNNFYLRPEGTPYSYCKSCEKKRTDRH